MAGLITDESALLGAMTGACEPRSSSLLSMNNQPWTDINGISSTGPVCFDSHNLGKQVGNEIGRVHRRN